MTFPELRADSAETLVVVFGDQLDGTARPLLDSDRDADVVLMMEVAAESTEVPSHRQRTVFFLSAMRHFALELAERGHRVHYIRLDDDDNTGSFEGELQRAIDELEPKRITCTEPGEWRVRELIETVAESAELPLEVHADDHFLTTREQFAEWMEGRKKPVMEYFYREQRKRLEILLHEDGQPAGGQWNFDQENREKFDRAPDAPRPYAPRTDDVTDEVIELVERCLPDLPGQLESFHWPVTRRQARRALDHFIEHRLASFGRYQDAMWTGERTLYHSLLSPLLNVKLLNPRHCVDRAVQAYLDDEAPLNSVEGFVRQIIGWREFIRGVYWYEGDGYGGRNGLDEHGELPGFYWTGDTDMNCLSDCVSQVLETGYGHHIQRLMVTGNFALVAGVHPREISDWYLGMYVDAVDWVTLPNTLGMVMHADGGVVGTKPYASTGKYIQRMSNYCGECRYDPKQRTGDDACPFTTFYWDFLLRHYERFKNNHRMALILKNVDRMSSDERGGIREHAKALRAKLGIASG